jgi:hypothetical protein
MKIKELLIETFDYKVLYHGSWDELPVGTILSPRDTYEDNWGSTSFYHALEYYRPPNMLAHKQGVFMCDNPDDIDLAGGATDFLFTVVPIGPVQRHDLNWGSEVSSLIDLGYAINSEEVKNAAEAYWAGEESPNEVLWEYIAPKAKIIKVEEY